MSLPESLPANPEPASVGNPSDAPEAFAAGLEAEGPTLAVNSEAKVGHVAPGRRGWSRLGLGGASSAFSASLLLMASSLLSGLFSLLRQKLVAVYFGTGTEAAAYQAAFQLPDMILYLLIGGAASSALITILSRYAEDVREGDRALSAILNVVIAVLLLAVLLGEVFTPQYVAWAFPKFQAQPEVFHLCVHLTRILLVGPLFFFAGGVFGARLLVRRIFVYQAVAPILYSGGIMLGAVLGHRALGIDSLAYGAMAGAFTGPLLMNFLGARRTGLRWSAVWDLRHPALREWFVLSLPLMLGQSLTTTDTWIRNWLVSGDKHALSRLGYARQIFTAPMNVLGPAAGTASLPFFASLWQRGDVAAFSTAVDKAVSRMIAVSLLVAGWMIGLAPLLIDLGLRGGRFTQVDAAATTRYFVLYTLGLFLWTSQNLYARGFYAAGNTLTPMLSGTVVTVISIPIYAALFRGMGAEGLVWAADVGMLLHTGALAGLLHRKRMVSLAELEFGEIGKALVAAVLGGLGAFAAARFASFGALVGVVVGSVVWCGVCFGALIAVRSELPRAVLRRKQRVSESASQQVSG